MKAQKLIGPLVGCFAGAAFVLMGMMALFFGVIGNYQVGKMDLPLTPFAELKPGDQVRLEGTLTDEPKQESLLMGNPCVALQVKVSAVVETWNDSTESTSYETREIWLEQKGPEHLTFSTNDGGAVVIALDKVKAAGSTDSDTQDQLPEFVPADKVPAHLVSEANHYKIEELIFSAGPVFYLTGKAKEISTDGVLSLDSPKVYPGTQAHYIENMKSGARIGTWAGIAFIAFGLIAGLLVSFVVNLLLKHFGVIEE